MLLLLFARDKPKFEETFFKMLAVDDIETRYHKLNRCFGFFGQGSYLFALGLGRWYRLLRLRSSLHSYPKLYNKISKLMSDAIQVNLTMNGKYQLINL